MPRQKPSLSPSVTSEDDPPQSVYRQTKAASRLNGRTVRVCRCAASYVSRHIAGRHVQRKTYELLPRRKCTENTMCRATDAKSVGVMRGTLNLCSFSLPIGWDAIPFFFALFHPQLTPKSPQLPTPGRSTRCGTLRHAAFTPEKWQLKM